jgi:hypothetical protein
MTDHPTAVAIARAQDVLGEAQCCVECLRLAAGSLGEKTEAAPIQHVASIASAKIDEAMAMLEGTKAK